jgi:predicted transcriptional regulator
MNVDNQRRTTQIVAAYMRKNLIPTDQIAGLINSVHLTLSGLGNPPVLEELPHVPAVSVRRSVRPDYVICIECGYKGKMLKKHLQSKHGLSADQYKVRWNLPSDHPTTAPNYSEHRSKLAKSFGLGRAPKQPAALPAARSSATKPVKPARRRTVSTATRTQKTAKKATAKKATPASRKPSSRRASKVATAQAGAPLR